MVRISMVQLPLRSRVTRWRAIPATIATMNGSTFAGTSASEAMAGPGQMPAKPQPIPNRIGAANQLAVEILPFGQAEFLGK